MMKRKDLMAGYEPLTWEGDSELEPWMQEAIEIQRRDIWRHGIREPLLTQMAFEFGYVVCASRLRSRGGQP